MGDPLKKVLPGQELSIPAQAYNAFVEAALAHRGVKSHGVAVPERQYSRHPGLIRVRNTTAGVLARFAPVGLSGVAIDPTASLANFQNTPILNAIGPGSSSYLGKFAVLQEPLASGAVGDAVLSGVTVSQISVQHATHDRADVDTSGGPLLVTSYYAPRRFCSPSPAPGPSGQSCGSAPLLRPCSRPRQTARSVWVAWVP